MIARIWQRAVRAEDAAAYAAYAEQIGIEGYRRTADNCGAQLLRRTKGDRAEFIVWHAGTPAFRPGQTPLSLSACHVHISDMVE